MSARGFLNLLLLAFLEDRAFAGTGLVLFVENEGKFSLLLQSQKAMPSIDDNLYVPLWVIKRKIIICNGGKCVMWSGGGEGKVFVVLGKWVFFFFFSFLEGIIKKENSVCFVVQLKFWFNFEVSRSEMNGNLICLKFSTFEMQYYMRERERFKNMRIFAGGCFSTWQFESHRHGTKFWRGVNGAKVNYEGFFFSLFQVSSNFVFFLFFVFCFFFFCFKKVSSNFSSW